ncbi:deoxyhypusine synthase [Heterostelium album PN500]|uniref:deoxyhypusine synthase n=1 Tax=Heterostelium pallidum (strain ATCC 26659 / Pp 5 / PN500) TaxID=670386 RepID=D3AXR9_HETP5|nr:deoxyhypusine synthase [Heterostelium album PN500]EFA85746.1 deoxyhypusine synthase [Heterostelium album PN500]|eukprot:XP_020437852.1 deoxyhypusine synthase [Heterostelium album PN500]
MIKRVPSKIKSFKVCKLTTYISNYITLNFDQSAKDFVFVQSNPEDLANRPTIKGYDFNNGVDYGKLFESYINTGFQASSVGQAIEEINRMLNWRLSDEPLAEGEENNVEERKNTRTKIFLGYTSNLVSSGVRETIRYLVQHSMVDVLVTTAGGVEEDFIKCLAPTYLGEFSLPGADLRRRGLNRIGNLLVPNDNYCKFEDWIMPILDKMVDEQTNNGTLWTPSRVINRLGKEINNEESIYYWAWKNNIPVFCPAITDGSIGDMMYFHSYNKPGLVLDLITDIRNINNHAIYSKKTGMIILGGGVIKHHICNANLFRNGAEFAVYLNTGQEFDGSDSGARPDEAVSWGKIKVTAKPVKIYAEATVVFPILVAETFAKNFKEKSPQELLMNKRDIF